MGARSPSPPPERDSFTGPMSVPPMAAGTAGKPGQVSASAQAFDMHVCSEQSLQSTASKGDPIASNSQGGADHCL